MSNTDYKVPILETPSHAVSELEFHPNKDLLAVASFDKTVRILEIDIRSNETTQVAGYSHDKSVLCCRWSPDGSRLASGCSGGVLKVYDVGTGQTLDLGKLEGGIRSLVWASPTEPIIATGSWDKTLSFWNLGTKSLIQTIPLPGKCFAMDVTYPFLAVATSDRHILLFDLNNPTKPYRETFSMLKWQTRSICTTANPEYCYVVGNLEGRAALSFPETKNLSKCFTFKCHRPNDVPQSVNSVKFHPTIPGIVATAGSNNTFSFWSLPKHCQVYTCPEREGPITAATFNSKGTLYAYATGNDFSNLDVIKTYSGKENVGIHIHNVKTPELTKK